MNMGAFYLLFGINLLLLASLFLGKTKSESKNQVHIVYMGGLSSGNGGGRSVHAEIQGEIMKRKSVDSVVLTYNKSFLGFAARLSDEEANEISQRYGVVSVFPDQVSQLHTTRSWDFLSSIQNGHSKFDYNPSYPPVSDWSTESDTIIGIIDTGIWPEHPSFNDEYIGPIPSRWNGTCMVGVNSTYSFKCNRKVIGARYYDDPEYPGKIATPLDFDGHGTHVASIAAGRHVWEGASYNDLAQGVPRGGSPGSRIAVYCVCAPEVGCSDSSVLKAFDDAIADGVDVINLSMGLGASGDLAADAISIGSFHAADKGIIVVGTAGNNGPSTGTVGNAAPWILTVAATTVDRDFVADIVLGDDSGKTTVVVKGGGINFSGLSKSPVYPLVDGRSASSNQTDVFNASNCISSSLDGGKVKGRIVLCENKDHYHGTSWKFNMLKKQGAVGIIMIDNHERQVAYKYNYPPTSPIVIVDQGDGAIIRSYINSTSNPLGTILPTVTVLNHRPAPVAAYFSSRGPVPDIENLLKPDIAAPGVDILGAWRLNDTDEVIPGKKEPPLFNILSGTSMACPHVSGLAAMVKSQHPTWSPSAIKSAIITTAIQRNNLHAPITTDDGSRARPYDIGAGEISLFGPLCPGLVYETETIDYLQFLCNAGYNTSAIISIASTVPDNFSCLSNSNPDLISDMNYPSIAVSGLKPNESKTVKRTVTNVGEEYSTYKLASLEVPPGMHVQVVPKKLHFSKNVKKQSFQVTFIRTTTASSGHLFGSLIWSNRKTTVRSPLVVTNA